MRIKTRWILAIVSFVIFGYWFVQQNDYDSKSAVTSISEEFVKDELFSPTSALFSEQTMVKVSEDTWLLTGTVNSQNVFGTIVRNSYIMSIAYESDSKEYFLTYLTWE